MASDLTAQAFTIFTVLFEVVSAYGTVGLSLGYPNTNASFSSQLHSLSKLVIIAMQIRGRHRGLPYALDKAVLLPSEEQQRKEHDEGLRRMQRTATGMSTRSLGLGPSNTIGRAATVARPDEIVEEDEDHTHVEDFVASAPLRRPSGLSMNSESSRGKGKKRNGLVSLIEGAFTAGPAKKD